MSKIITADCDWIKGTIQYGHYDLQLSDDEYEEFKKLSEEEQINYVYENADLVVDLYDIDECGKPSNIQVL